MGKTVLLTEEERSLQTYFCQPQIINKIWNYRKSCYYPRAYIWDEEAISLQQHLIFQAGRLLCVVISASQITRMEVKTSEDHLKIHKMRKKVLRKQVRAQHTLMRHEGIECISHATQVTGSSDFVGSVKMLLICILFSHMLCLKCSSLPKCTSRDWGFSVPLWFQSRTVLQQFNVWRYFGGLWIRCFFFF